MQAQLILKNKQSLCQPPFQSRGAAKHYLKRMFDVSNKMLPSRGAPSRTRAVPLASPVQLGVRRQGYSVVGKEDGNVTENDLVQLMCFGSVSIKKIELCSAILSLFAFIASIGFIVYAHTHSKPNYNPAFPLWWSDITIVDITDTDKATSVQNFGIAWEEMCEKNKASDVNGTQIQLQENRLQIVPATRLMPDGFYPVYMLLWIFFISFVFQYSRSQNQWFARFFGYDAAAKVEYTRWLEYGLTSPLQIWIVAALFFVGDVMTMLALAGAQLGLVLLGALIEYFNARGRKKQKKKNEPKAKAAYRCAYTSCLLAWAIHALIWVPLFLRFRYQIDKSDQCVPESTKENWDAARGWVELTFFLEFALFTCFGLWLSYVTFFENTAADELSDKENQRSNRVHSSGIYALLSVTAKVALDFGFIGLIFVRAQEPS